MVIGTFLIALNIAPIAKKARLENLCIELKYTLSRDYPDRYKQTITWYDKKRKVLTKQIIKLAGMQYKGNSSFAIDGNSSYATDISAKICEYHIEDFYGF